MQFAAAHLPSKAGVQLQWEHIRAANNGATEEVNFYADHIDSYMSIGMMTAHGAINGFRIAWRRSALLVAPTITPELKNAGKVSEINYSPPPQSYCGGGF